MKIIDGALAIKNVPVPRLRYSLTRHAEKIGAQLRVVDFSTRALRSLSQAPSSMSQEEQIAEVGGIAKAIFRRVDEFTASYGARSVIVYLPTQGDLNGPNAWESWLISTMDTLDHPFINLAEELRRIPDDLVQSYFIPLGLPGQTHYTRSGNRWAASTLYRRFLEEGLL